MDPLSILGVAAAAVQFVDFSQRLFSETWHVYHSVSGQTLQLQNLSAISADISKLSIAVRETFESQQRDASALEGPDKELLHLCQECEDIATKILAVMPNISKNFETQLATDKEVILLAEQNGLRSYELKSVGECFRVALRSWWARDEIARIGERLEKVRQGMVTAATMSIWRNSQSTKNWEHQLSSKLDTMIERLSQPLETGPQQNEGHTDKTVEKAAIESIRRNKVIIQIQDRLWRADWKPDTQILSSFPKQTGLSVEELNSFICNSLRFDSMENREEAITKSFGSTFQWIFDRDPQISLGGAPMWSSFPAWLEGNYSLPYWITGKPGSGKSTMMKFILQHPFLREHLQKWSQGSPQYTIKYYAWRPGAEMARSEDGLLRTLLHQILDLNPKMIPFLCPRRWSLFHAVREVDSFPPWATWELEESFGRLLQMEDDKPLLALFIDGLDEFDVAPVDLCKRILTISSHKSVKVCVASRPWPQFSDAFAASPGLQMHLLTNSDIQSFIRGHFRGVVAFQELNDVYHGRGEVLLTDVATRSKGVFLWTSLVTRTLLESLIEGSSLSHLQEILDAMPSEIEDLYDAIYAAIPKRLLPDVSVMLQLYVRAFQPVDWITLWLADEARSQPTDPPAPVRDSDMENVQVVLKRRLSARTRGILELVPQTRTVEYLHRTAVEWVNLPRVWQEIKSASPPCFDPHACLLQAEVIQRENPDQSEPIFNPGDFYHMGNFKFWKNVVRMLHYASQVDETVVSDAALAAVLDRFHDAATKKFTKSPGYMTLVSEKNMPWASYHRMKPDNVKVNTFDGLVTQFAILHYIRHKFHKSPNLFHAVPKRFSTALLEQAIFGPGVYFSEETIAILNQPNIQINTKSRRLQVVEFLLQQGVRQPGVLLKVKARQLDAGNKEDAQYLDGIMQLLNRYRAVSGEKRSFIKGLLGSVKKT